MAAVRDLGIKAGDMMLIPSRLAIALQLDGWWVRKSIVWAKPNPLPESVRDRPTSSHETVLMLTRSRRYFYDRLAVLEDVPDSTVKRLQQDVAAQQGSYRAHAGAKSNGSMKALGSLVGANRRDVWTIPAEPIKDAHFAVFPPRLAELCILAGTSEGGACAKCGMPQRRVTADKGADLAWQRRSGGDKTGAYAGVSAKGHAAAGVQDASAVKSRILVGQRVRETTGWRPGCRCKPGDIMPCTVLDPFGGAGTTGLVADRLRRDAILIELSPRYAAMARRRIAADAPLFGPVAPSPAPAEFDMFNASQEAAD